MDRISAIALAAVAALALTAELAMAEQRRVGQYLPWLQMGSSPGLNDLPSAPKSFAQTPGLKVQPGPPEKALGGPANGPPKSAAWHESVLMGDIVGARKSAALGGPDTKPGLRGTDKSHRLAR